MSARLAVASWVGLLSSIFRTIAVRMEVAMTMHFETCVEASALWRKGSRPAQQRSR